MALDHVYIIGAGLSSYAGLPLTGEFTRVLTDERSLSESGPSVAMIAFLRRFISEAFDHQLAAKTEYWPELEDVFTCLDISANTGHHLGRSYSPRVLRTLRRALIARAIRMLRQCYERARKDKTRQEPLQQLDSLLSHMPLDEAGFVSTNWDTVVESRLAIVQSVKQFDYGCAAKYAGFDDNAVVKRKLRFREPVQLIKLHGSTNWLYCDNCRELFWFPPGCEEQIAKQIFRDHDWHLLTDSGIPHANKATSARPSLCPSCRADALGTRLATFSYRKALDFPMFERSWLSAEAMLRSAANWIFIGYSLPAADFEFKHLLKQIELSRKKQPNVVLITGGTGRTRDNYWKFFGRKLRGQMFDAGLTPDALKHLKSIGALT